MLEIGEGRWAHASGALWLPDCQTLLIADAHLGYGWAQRRRGELGPLRDQDAVGKLEAVLDELGPEEVVVVGDLVHAPKPGVEERALIQKSLEQIEQRARLRVVLGNHDRALERDFGVQALASYRCGEVLAIHGNRLPEDWEGHLVMGHFHPAYSIQDAAGARRRLPVFAATERFTILPAFSPFAAGLNLRFGWPAELKTLLGGRRPKLFAVTGKRVVALAIRRKEEEAE